MPWVLTGLILLTWVLLGLIGAFQGLVHAALHEQETYIWGLGAEEIDQATFLERQLHDGWRISRTDRLAGSLESTEYYVSQTYTQPDRYESSASSVYRTAKTVVVLERPRVRFRE